MTEYLEEVKTFPAEWVTDETPSRKVTLLGKSGIDPDIYVAELAGVKRRVWVMIYNGSIIDTNPPIKAMPDASSNPLPTTEGVTQGWQPIETAPRDGTWIIAQCGQIANERYNFWSGRCFVVKHMGKTNNMGLDMGWALFPGMGVGDKWLANWIPLPPPPGQTHE